MLCETKVLRCLVSTSISERRDAVSDVFSVNVTSSIPTVGPRVYTVLENESPDWSLEALDFD